GEGQGRSDEPAVADRFHLSKGDRVGLVLSVERARRLLPLHCGLEAVRQYAAEEVTATLDLALRASGLDQATPADRPRLLSDNGSSYVAGDLAKWLGDRNIKHLRGAPYHPMTQGKIERWHQTLKIASCWKITSCLA